MIIGIGIDIVDIRRIKNIVKKYNKKFINRCFTSTEINQITNKSNQISLYARKYAAKEACSKALGTGLTQGIFWRDISVENNNFGKPFIKLTGNALKRLNKLSNKKIGLSVSISDEKIYAIANVIIFENNENI